MIPARKGGPWGWVLGRYVEWKLRAAFRGLWRQGALPAGPGPWLVYANHTGFWDGFVAHALCQAAAWDGYCAMEERNLARYRFLTRLGAFSVPRGKGAHVRSSLRYALSLLERPRTALFLFPQGKLQPFGAPLALEGGLGFLARRSGVRCLPLAIRYLMLEHELPDVVVDVGVPHAPLPELEGYAERLAQGVHRLEAVRSLEGLQPVLQGRRGVAERWDRVRRLTGGAT